MLNLGISPSFSNCIVISQGVNNSNELGILLMLRELFTTVVPQTQFLNRNSQLLQVTVLKLLLSKKKKKKNLDNEYKFISLKSPITMNGAIVKMLQVFQKGAQITGLNSALGCTCISRH